MLMMTINSWNSPLMLFIRTKQISLCTAASVGRSLNKLSLGLTVQSSYCEPAWRAIYLFLVVWSLSQLPLRAGYLAISTESPPLREHLYRISTNAHPTRQDCRTPSTARHVLHLPPYPRSDPVRDTDSQPDTTIAQLDPQTYTKHSYS